MTIPDSSPSSSPTSSEPPQGPSPAFTASRSSSILLSPDPLGSPTPSSFPSPESPFPPILTSTPSFNIEEGIIQPPADQMQQPSPSKSHTIPDSAQKSAFPESLAAPSQTDQGALNVVTVNTGEVSKIQLKNENPILAVSSDGQQVQIDLRDNFPGANSVLTVMLLSPESAPNRNSVQQMESVVLEVVLFDAFGNEVKTFSESVELCFSAQGGTSGKCLGFYDESKREWVCTDSCLKKKQNLIWFVFFFCHSSKI